MSTTKRTKKCLEFAGEYSEELAVDIVDSVSDGPRLVLSIRDPVYDESADVHLSWNDARTLKRWLGRRLKE